MRLLGFVCACLAGVCLGVEPVGEWMALPAPQKQGGMPLMEALAARKTNRQNRGPAPTLAQLSDLLWAANGVSRPDGRRTAPSAMNRQEIQLAVLTADGLYQYDPAAHDVLWQPVGEAFEEVRAGASALVIFYYDSAEQSREYALIDTGFVGQNIYLLCASKGWSCAFLGAFNRRLFAAALECEEAEVLFAQRVGLPAAE